jgi:hypothetical protein
MKPSKSNSRRVLAFMAVVLGAMLTTMLLPAHAQQEIDPTWYDPYAVHDATAKAAPSAATTVALHTPQPAVVFHRHAAAVKTVSSAPGAGKLHEKQPAAQPRIADATLPGEPNEEQRSARVAR